uniref:ubiquitinyl hydrolase 1 n=1 Tax=Xenopus tropicalis TaxID=8364 RepID=A0A803JU74_XENTR
RGGCGSCRPGADQVYGDQDMHEVVRKHCMDYLMKNADYFSNYVTEDFTTYINRKRKNNCHGNHIEMQAMAEMYNRPVEVYQYGTGTGPVPSACWEARGVTNVSGPRSMAVLCPTAGTMVGKVELALSRGGCRGLCPSNQTCAGADRATSPLVSLYPALECRAIMQHMSPTAFGLKDWDDDEILASVLAVSQQEYLDTIKKSTLRRDSSPDHS